MSGDESFRKEFHRVPGLDARAALHPWDEETFGFPTGEVEIGADLEAGESLRKWMADEGVAMLMTSVNAQDSGERRRLQTLGFLPVEETFSVAIPRLGRAELPPSPVRLRLADARDLEGIQDLARRAFRFGRFFTDPLFPVHLARERMADWVRRAVSSEDPADVVLVEEAAPGDAAGSRQAPGGFFHVRTTNGRAQLQLGASDPEKNDGLGGVGLFVETLRWLQSRDVRSVRAEIAAANTAVVNVYARLGFHFTRLDITMHIHSPHAPYLRG